MHTPDCLDEPRLETPAAPDAARFLELYEGSRRQVFNLLLALLRDRHDAEDLASLVAMQALRKFGQLREEGAFRSWICRIARNMALNELTKAGSKSLCMRTEACDLDTVPSPEASPEAELVQDEVQNVLDRVIALLRPIDAQVIDLFYFSGMSLKQMQRALGTPANETDPAVNVPLGTVKRRLHDARRRLKSVISKLSREREIDLDAFLP